MYSGHSPALADKRRTGLSRVQTLQDRFPDVGLARRLAAAVPRPQRQTAAVYLVGFLLNNSGARGRLAPRDVGDADAILLFPCRSCHSCGRLRRGAGRVKALRPSPGPHVRLARRMRKRAHDAQDARYRH